MTLKSDARLADICRGLLPLIDCGDAPGQIPGAVTGIVTRDGHFGSAATGYAQIEPISRPMASGSWFDLASLTKVMVTTRLILELAEAGALDLDDPLARHIPDLRQYDVAGAPERKLTIRQCLGHRTFLPAVEPIYTWGNDAETLKAHVLQKVWDHGPPVYSDINFILLGIVIERIIGKPLSALPMPSGLSFSPDPDQTAATEFCRWRNRLICGEVHDENAHALGGVAGHAPGCSAP